MYEITPEKVSLIFENLSDNDFFSATIVTVKTLAVAFVLINWISEYIKSMDKTGNDIYNPVSMSSILTSILYVALIVGGNHLLNLIDGVVNAYTSNFHFESGSIYNIMLDYEYINTGESPVTTDPDYSMSKVLGLIWDILTEPFFMILTLLKCIAWIVSVVIFPVFYIERELLLFIMKIMFPFILALAALKQYRNLFWNWIKLYCAIFFTGIFFGVVDYITVNLYYELNKMADGGAVAILYFLIIIFAKVQLYKSAVTLSYKIFS